MVHPESSMFFINDTQCGNIYTFLNIGDEIPLHDHPIDKYNHITFVLFGEVAYFRFNGDMGTPYSAKPGGTLIIVPVGETHGFRALTPGATIINIVKGQMI